jgi:hypothetical protein
MPCGRSVIESNDKGAIVGGVAGHMAGHGKLGAAKHVWSIRTKLQIEGRSRDLAMFNLAIDSKLRGCSTVACPGLNDARLEVGWSAP